MPTLSFDALEPLEKRIHQVRADIAYVSVSETVDRKSYENLGRIDFNATDLAPYMLDGDIEEFEAAGQLPDLTDAPVADDETMRMADAVCRWIRETVASNMHGQEEGRFRLYVWRPKGETILFTARFSCTDLGYVAPVPAKELEVVETQAELLPTIRMTTERELIRDALPEGRVWGALGAGHVQLIELTQKTYGHLATLQNITIGNQNTQILRMSKVIEDLAADRLKVVANAVHTEEVRRADEGESRVPIELGKQFISELGTFGRVIASSKLGMTPEMVELAEIVNASPELMEAMKHPEVRKLLRDEKNRKELVEMLNMAAGIATPSSSPAPGQSTAA